MAITQSRLKSIVLAGKAFQDQWTLTRQAVHAILKSIPAAASPNDLQSALRAVQLTMERSIVEPQHGELLVSELTHIKLTEKKNAKVAEYQRRKRAAEGARPSPHLSPNAIAPNPYKSLPSATPSPSAGVSPLADLKMRYNALHRDFGMHEPYANPLDEGEGLLPEHVIAAKAEGLLTQG